jgi:hypothetical protein
MKKALIISIVMVMLISVLSIGISIMPNTADAITCYPLSPPDNPIPTNSSVDISVSTGLDWNGYNASVYDVYFGTNDTPSDLVANNISVRHWVPDTILSYNTSYYWKIVAWDACGNNNSSAIWNFTTGCPLPGTPDITSPTNSSTGVSINADLDWVNSSDATYYQVYFGTNASLLTLNGSTNESSWPLPTLSVNTTYYWQVVAKNICGSTNGSIWSFTTATSCPIPGTPASPSPAHASTGVSVSTSVLDWSDCANTSAYQVYFGTNSSALTQQPTTTSSNGPMPTLSYNTTYYWKIVANNSCGGSTNGSIWNFTTECATPGDPASPAPNDTSTLVSVNADLDWDNSSAATYYQVYFGTNASLLTLNGSPNASSWPLPILSVNTTYYWKIVARNTCGFTNGTTWSFTTECLAPVAPVVTSPANASTGISIDADLDWGDSLHAAGYQVYFGTNASLLALNGSPSASSWALPILSVNTTYYWKIVANNTCGSTNGTIWSFTTGCAVPSKPQTVPALINGSTNVSINVMLDWADCTNASSYDVYFDTSASPAYYANTSSSSYQLSQLAYSTKYYWKVVAKNSCGTNNSSDIWNFTTVAAPTPPPTISFDIGGTHASWNTSSTGVIPQAVNVVSADGEINIHIPAGTTALNDEGEPLDELNMSSTAAYPAASGDRAVIAAFNFDPDGATFNPGIQITLTYDPDTIPAGVNESSLIIAFYNESSEGWEYITGVVNTGANTITFTVRHFTTFTIQTPPVKHAGGGVAAWVIIVIVFFFAIVLGVIAGLYLKHRRIYGSLYYEDEGAADDQYDKDSEDRENEEDFKF